MVPVRNPRRLPPVVATVNAARVVRGGRARTWLEHESDPAAMAPAAVTSMHVRAAEHPRRLNLGIGDSVRMAAA